MNIPCQRYWCTGISPDPSRPCRKYHTNRCCLPFPIPFPGVAHREYSFVSSRLSSDHYAMPGSQRQKHLFLTVPRLPSATAGGYNCNCNKHSSSCCRHNAGFPFHYDMALNISSSNKFFQASRRQMDWQRVSSTDVTDLRPGNPVSWNWQGHALCLEDCCLLLKSCV